MKVFVAAAPEPHAPVERDADCIEGELVWMVAPCPLSQRYPEGPCACGRTFSGMYSRGETSTAIVRDVDGLTRADFEAALEASHSDHPECTCPWDTQKMAADLLRRAARWADGAVVGRRLDVLFRIRESV